MFFGKFITKCLIILLISHTLKVYANSKEWKQVPLRSIDQKNAGLSGGEGMQMIQGFAFAPSNPQIVYLVSDTSQVWKSTNGGKTWRMKHNGFFAKGGLSIEVDPVNENIVFIAGRNGYDREKLKPKDIPLCGIFRTTDGGDNWELVRKTFYFKRMGGDNGGKYFAFIPNEKDKTGIIYAGTFNNGLLKSEDGGDTWICCGFKDNNIYDIKVNTKDKSIIFIATSQGLFTYNDKNQEILKIGNGLPDYPRTIALNPNEPAILYAAVGSSGVYWSTDDGLTFTERMKGLPKGKNYVHISLSPVNPEYLYVSINYSKQVNPFWSHDGGAAWHSPDTLNYNNLSFFGEERFFSGQIEPHPANPNIALTSANGKARVLMTIDGGKNWFYSSNGYTGGRMGGGGSSLAFYDDPKKMLFFLIDHGPALTVDGGKTFRILNVPKINATTTPVGTVLSNSDSDILVTAIGTWHKQTVVVSYDGGKRWKVFSGTEDNYKFISFHPQKSDIVYAQGFISKDAGKSWTKLTQKIYALFWGNGDIVYSVSSAGKNKSVIKRSNNQGETWATPYPELPIKAKAINEIDIDPTNPDRIYAATNTGFYIYDGKKWLKIGDTSGLTKDLFGQEQFKCVAVDPKHSNIIYTGKWAPGQGHSNGVFRSIDYGKSWENITYNLGQPLTVWMISVSTHDGTVYLGSSHGTWKIDPPY